MVLVTCTTAALQTQRGAKNIALKMLGPDVREHEERSKNVEEEERILISVWVTTKPLKSNEPEHHDQNTKYATRLVRVKHYK